MNTDKTDLQRIVVFRTADPDNLGGMLYKELKEGRLRQGWGAPGLALLDANGKSVSKGDWEKNYQDHWNEAPSRRRYSALAKMLEIVEGDIVVLPNQPARGLFSIARVAGVYRFEENRLHQEDFGHVIPVAPNSLRTFNFRADYDADKISSLFSRARHRPPVTFVSDEHLFDAAVKLLEKESNLDAHEDMDAVAMNEAIRAAAKAMQEEIKKWNGHRFEEAVRRAFKNQGYTVEEQYRTFNRKGGDVDIVVSPPSKNYRLFMPQEIAVQVKWKQGIDRDDAHAVEQLVKWEEIDTVQKFVISSADSFTPKCKKMADEEGITLIGGLDTMYFLMGIDRVDEID